MANNRRPGAADLADRTLPGLGYTGPLTPRQPPLSPNRYIRRLHVLVLAVASLVSSAVSAQPADRYEPGGLPILAQDADVGIMLGGFAQLARFRDDRRPYAWRLQTLAIVSVREGATGTEMPYRETFVRFDRPSLWGRPLRLQVQLGYSRTTNLGYFGIGNATPAEAGWQSLPEGSPEYVQSRRYYQFDGVTPSGRLAVRLRLAVGVFATGEEGVEMLGEFRKVAVGVLNGGVVVFGHGDDEDAPHVRAPGIESEAVDEGVVGIAEES